MAVFRCASLERSSAAPRLMSLSGLPLSRVGAVFRCASLGRSSAEPRLMSLSGLPLSRHFRCLRVCFCFQLQSSSLAQSMYCSNMPQGCYVCNKDYLVANEVHWVDISERELKELQTQNRSYGVYWHRPMNDGDEFYLPMCNMCVSRAMTDIHYTMKADIRRLPELLRDPVVSSVMGYVCDSICDRRLTAGWRRDGD